MSFVSIVSTTKFVTVMSDGRLMRLNGEIVDENTKKFTLINDGKQFVAITGDYEYGLTFSEIFRTIKNTSPQELIEGAYNKAQSLDIKNRAFCISVGGVHNKEITVSIYDSDTNKTFHRKPIIGNYDPIFFGKMHHSPQKMNDIFSQIVNRSEAFPSHQQFLNMQREIHEEVAKHEISVNNIIFRDVIKLRDFMD